MKIANDRACSNGDWHDLLTELNDTPIVYEGQTYDPETNEVRGSILSGNPKYYNGWNFDWQRGRELAKAEQTDGTTDTTLTYAYDADGIRTGKTYKVETYETRYTVTFVADGKTVKTMTVADGYTLKTSDYPTVPAKSGYTGSWNKYTDAIHANITIEAVYQEIVYYTVKFVAQRVTIKTMTVEPGYILQDTDYPNIPPRDGYTAIWGFHTRIINKNTTITAQYNKTGGSGGGDIPTPTVRPTGSEDIMSGGLPEPIEPQDVEKPDDTSGMEQGETANDTVIADNTANSVETQASHPGQTLVSTQTVTHEYLTLSGKVVRETVKTNNSITYVLDFLYDESGRPFALNYSTNGGSSFTTYYYILNLQGDVVKLVTSSGSAVATYEYDAWGNILSKSGSMADKNPLRYRGYYYDTETGYYYLRSRYYDPANRRFINADNYASTGQGFVGTNMFAYCNNSPVIYMDDTGKSVGAVVEEYSYTCNCGEYLVTISVSVTASDGWGEHASVTFVENKPSLSISITDKDLKRIDYYLENKIYPSLKEKHTSEEKSPTSFGMSFGLAQYSFDVQQEIDEHFSLNVSVSVTSLSTLHAIGRAFGGLQSNISTGMGQNAAFASSGGMYLEYAFGGNLLSRLSYFFI